MEAKVFGNLKAGNDRLGFTRTGLGAGCGLQHILGGFLAGEAFDDQERYEECEH
jgi:hypothetical protein